MGVKPDYRVNYPGGGIGYKAKWSEPVAKIFNE